MVTVNNPAPEFESLLAEAYGNAEYCIEFAVGQREIAPTTGTEHFQGFVIFTERRTLATLKRWLPTAHWEVAKARTNDKPIAYCTKEDTRKEGTEPFTIGAAPEGGQGKSKELQEVKRKLDDGVAQTEIMDSHFETWLRHYKGLQLYTALKTAKRNHFTMATYVVGPTGTGKSTYAREHSPDDAYWKQRSEWWDGYDGQSHVILDDFYGWLRYDDMLRLLDRNPLLVQVKGGQANFVAQQVYVTSNKLPPAYYSRLALLPGGLESLYRRFNQWIYLGKEDLSIVSNSYEEFLEELDRHHIDVPALFSKIE